MSDLHVTPSAAKVADVVDYDGWHAATERWGWLGQGTLARLAAKGRSQRKAVPKVKPTYGSAYSVYREWDGASTDSMTVDDEASVLGLTAATITIGNA